MKADPGDAPTDSSALAAATSEDLGPWDLHKFWAEANRRSIAKCPVRGYAVAVTTGAMNPAHLGHVQMMHKAKERLEAEGYGVLGLWISPSHDGYVRPKCQSLKTMWLSAEFRLEVARLATVEDEHVSVGSWEARFPGRWPDFPVVAGSLQEHLAAEPAAAELLRGPSGHPQVFYVCGSDHAQKCGLWDRGMMSKRDVGVVVVPRAGDKLRKTDPRQLVFVAHPTDGHVAALSSTKVRRAISAANESGVSQALPAAAIQFVLKPTVAQCDRFADDFERLGTPRPADA